MVAKKKIESLQEIKTAVAVETEAKTSAPRKANKDKQGRSYATGKRKDAVARVWIKPGHGSITINDKFLRKHGKIKVEHGAHMPGMWRILPTSNTGEFLLLTAVLKGCLES